MSTRTRFLLWGGLALLALSVLLPWFTVTPASAQCGANASSCKRCHQGEEAYPVNDIGQWHIDHADSDFCQLCHGGDKSTHDADAAHEGMFDPLSERGQKRCAACHPADADNYFAMYQELAANPEGAANASEQAATATAETGYDWRNLALSWVAGSLTAVAGLAVWQGKQLGRRFGRKEEK